MHRFILLLLACFALILAGCSDDDDTSVTILDQDGELVIMTGTWRGCTSGLAGDSERDVVMFNAGTTAVAVETTGYSGTTNCSGGTNEGTFEITANISNTGDQSGVNWISGDPGLGGNLTVSRLRITGTDPLSGSTFDEKNIAIVDTRTDNVFLYIAGEDDENPAPTLNSDGYPTSLHDNGSLNQIAQ